MDVDLQSAPAEVEVADAQAAPPEGESVDTHVASSEAVALEPEAAAAVSSVAPSEEPVAAGDTDVELEAPEQAVEVPAAEPAVAAPAAAGSISIDVESIQAQPGAHTDVVDEAAAEGAEALGLAPDAIAVESAFESAIQPSTSEAAADTAAEDVEIVSVAPAGSRTHLGAAAPEVAEGEGADLEPGVVVAFGLDEPATAETPMSAGAEAQPDVAAETPASAGAAQPDVAAETPVPAGAETQPDAVIEAAEDVRADVEAESADSDDDDDDQDHDGEGGIGGGEWRPEDAVGLPGAILGGDLASGIAAGAMAMDSAGAAETAGPHLVVGSVAPQTERPALRALERFLRQVEARRLQLSTGSVA